MIRRGLAAMLLVGFVVGACGSDEPADPAPPEDTAAATPAEAAPVEVAVEPVAPVVRAPVLPRADEPWNPLDTGTIDPGMTREQVIAIWGVPVAERLTGFRSYIYFRNGCEYSCGTFDVVFLEDGKVVDVIARGPGHSYSGVSSSPAGGEMVTPPDMPLPPVEDTTATDSVAT